MVTVTRAQLAARRTTARSRPRRERDVQAAVLAYLATLPHVWAWRANTGAVKTDARFVRFGQRGQADVTGWRTMTVDGVKIAQRLEIEVKRPGARLSIPQAVFLERARLAGACVIVARSVDDVIRALR